MNCCKYCEKKLVPIGHTRSNGKNHKDWNSRKFHKCCFKIIMNLPEQYQRKWLED